MSIFCVSPCLSRVHFQLCLFLQCLFPKQSLFKAGAALKKAIDKINVNSRTSHKNCTVSECNKKKVNRHARYGVATHCGGGAMRAAEACVVFISAGSCKSSLHEDQLPLCYCHWLTSGDKSLQYRMKTLPTGCLRTRTCSPYTLIAVQTFPRVNELQA